jgi:hypothetical protein
MSTHETEDDMSWVPTWAQAMTDFRGEDDEPPFDDVTVRITVPASIGGSQVRVELGNRFGDEPLRSQMATATEGRRGDAILTVLSAAT